MANDLHDTDTPTKRDGQVAALRKVVEHNLAIDTITKDDEDHGANEFTEVLSQGVPCPSYGIGLVWSDLVRDGIVVLRAVNAVGVLVVLNLLALLVVKRELVVRRFLRLLQGGRDDALSW